MRLRNEISALLATRGYFSPQVDIHWDATPPRVTVQPGPLSHIRQLEIRVEGDTRHPLAQAVRAHWLLPVDTPFTQDTWDAAKNQALEQLLDQGYAGARISHSAARVDAATAQVDLSLDLASGPPYRFGPLRVEGLRRYDVELLQRYNPGVQAGQAYSPRALLELQRKLQNSPYFSTAQVGLDEDVETRADGSVTAPVRVIVSERTPHHAGVGLGASSNTGARLQLNAGTNDLFHQGWRLDSALRLEELRQGAFMDVFLPPDDRQRYWAWGTVRENTDIQGLKTSRVGTGLRRSVQRGKLGQTLSLNWQQEKRRPQDADASSGRALALTSAWSWRSAFDARVPDAGHAIEVQLGGASRQLLSSQSFVRAYARYQYGNSLPWGDTVILRAELGHTLAASRAGIPQDYLFRAGGSGSVRGYAYQSLGVKEGEAVVGGRHLVTASAEYTHWWGEYGLAAFIDAGDASDTRSSLSPALGYGLGGRWRSPAGPLGVDLAWGQQDKRLRLHFALALPF